MCGFISESRKRSNFVIDSYLKDSEFTAVKRDAKFYTRYMKGVPFFLSKMVYKRVGGVSSCKILFSNLPIFLRHSRVNS